MIHLTNISKQFGSQILLKDASIQINPGYRIGLVGPNGAGKTTLFRLIMKEEGFDSGTLSVSEKIEIAYFSQSVGEMKGRSALEEAKAEAGKISELARRLKVFETRLERCAEEPLDDDAMTKLLEEFGEVQLEFEQRGGYDFEAKAKEILTGLGISPEDQLLPVEHFSGGWKMRIALAKVLLMNPDVLLMDEPTNHLDLESILWLEEWLTQYRGALVMTSHDRDFMNRLVNQIAEVGNGKITVYGGNYDFYEREREIRKRQLEASHRKQQDMLAKEEEFIARFAARASHAAQVQSRIKKLDKIERVELPPEQKRMAFTFPTPPRSGNDVVKLNGLGKVWELPDGREKHVFHGISGLIRRLDKIAVVGVNGAGKSTFLKILAGQTEATEGSAVIGAGVNIGYFSQHALDVLNPNRTILEEIYERIPSAGLGYARNLLGAFLFSGDDVDKKVGVLSGGEKSRLLLATLLSSPVNFLILDEPTNHLDIVSREVLLEAIMKFEGTVVMVSHDRHFLRSIGTTVYEIDHGALRVYEGGYERYLEKAKEQLRKAGH